MYPVQYKMEALLLCNPRVKTFLAKFSTFGLWSRKIS